MWSRCNYVCKEASNNDAFIEHVKTKHIDAQKRAAKFRCMWKGCNVYEKPSSSFKFLEHHVMDHIDKKPYMCIFSGCNRKFRTELLREKHTHAHLNNQDQAAGILNGGGGSGSHFSSLSASPVKGAGSGADWQQQQILNSAKKAIINTILNGGKDDSSIGYLNLFINFFIFTFGIADLKKKQKYNF